ncbi:hypothetical protein TNCV_1164741 [Trichonephila clavipes]|nr:hypothetical protein TNCV_1164741 [Trichonephila clavipes]
MLDQGIIMPSKSNWCFSLHMVSKKDTNSWRPCGGYPMKERFDLGTFHAENEYLSHHVKMIVIGWWLLLVCIDITPPENEYFSYHAKTIVIA